MPYKSSTIVPKSRVSWPLSALHREVCANLYAIVYFFQISEIWDMNLMNLIYIWLLMVMSLIRTCHNKLHYASNMPSPHFTFKFGIISRVDVLDNQGSSSFNFNSSFIRWRDRRMFLHTTTVLKNHFDKCTIYQNTVDNALSLIMWISVVPHQVGVTTIVKVAWIWRFLGETHIHTP